MKKKYLAWLTNTQDYDDNISRFVTGSELLINKICHEFEKIYIIDIRNLKFFSKKKKINTKLDKKLKLPNNVEIFNPLDVKDFKNFMIGKELLAIEAYARGFFELKVRFILARLKIKQIQINNFGNIQTNLAPVKGFFWKGFLEKIRHDYSHKFTVLLTNLRLISKMEIRFTDDSRFIEYRKKSKRLLKKFFNYFNLHYSKELILVNSKSFDETKENKLEIREDRIVLLDVPLSNIQLKAWTNPVKEEIIKKHYYNLYKLAFDLSKFYKKKIVACLHPIDNLEEKKKYFPDCEVTINETKEHVFKSFIVLFTCGSSAIIDAILLKKKILIYDSDALDENQLHANDEYAKRCGIVRININEEININKNTLSSKLDDATKLYDNHIKSNIAPDGNNIGYEKIIKTIKERFFN